MRRSVIIARSPVRPALGKNSRGKGPGIKPHETTGDQPLGRRRQLRLAGIGGGPSSVSSCRKEPAGDFALRLAM
jgi:hypothetical protein